MKGYEYKTESDLEGVGERKGRDETNKKFLTYRVVKNKIKCKWYASM